MYSSGGKKVFRLSTNHLKHGHEIFLEKSFLGFKKFSSIKQTQIIFLSRRNMDGVVYMQTGACGLKTCEWFLMKYVNVWCA